MRRIKGKKNINTLEFWERTYSRREFLDRAVDRLIFYDAVLSLITKEWGEKPFICELGCGEGIGLHFLKHKFPISHMTGFDFSQKAIDFANKNYAEANLNFFVADINMIFEKGSHFNNYHSFFNQILIIETLEHLEKPKKLINKCLDKCEELIITVPNAYKCCEELTHIITGFKRKSFKGYKVLHYSTFRNDRNLLVKLKGKL